MKRTIKENVFFRKQPPMTFVDELKKMLHSQKPKYYG